jgi:hypothetical protein
MFPASYFAEKPHIFTTFSLKMPHYYNGWGGAYKLICNEVGQSLISVHDFARCISNRMYRKYGNWSCI